MKRAQPDDALGEREAFIRNMADHAPGMLWVTDPDGARTFVSRGWYDYTGQSKEKGLGSGWLDVIHPDDRESTAQTFADANASRQSFSVDYRLRRSDGEYRWAIDSGRPRFADGGDFLGFVGSVIDVHERRQAQELRTGQARVLEMIASEESLAEILSELVAFIERRIPDAIGSILLLDDDGRRLQHGAAPRLPPAYNEAIDGVEIGEGVGSCGTAVHRGERVIVEDIQTDPLWSEFRDLAASHDLRACWSEPIRSVDGPLLGTFAIYFRQPRRPDAADLETLAANARFAGIAIDRPRAQAALRKSEQRFRMLADNMSQLAWTCEELCEVNWYNRRWLDYTGYSFEEMQGSGWKKVHHPDHIERVVETIRQARETGTVWEDTFPLRGKDGNYRWFLSRAIPIRNQDDGIVSWFGTNTDITELRETQQLLRETDRRKDEFLATLAHELRNPLAPIRTGLELMGMVIDDPDELEEIRSVMQRQTQQLITLVDDLLDVSRITRGKLELRKSRVALRDVVQSAVEASRPFIEDAGHQLTVEQTQSPVYLEADPHRLAQVLSNLLNNAAKYTPRGGRIWLTVDLSEADVRMTVKDTGIGIPEELFEQIFEMFAQIDRPIEKGYTGLGIGLTLVQRLVEMHDGQITVHSDGPDQGSEFTVCLPIAVNTPPDNETSEDATGRRHATGLRILLVDDNRDGAEMLATVIRKLGNEVQLAYDGQQAVEAAASYRPDAILMDLGMPKMNGYDAASTIRAEPWGRDTVLIALTGWGQEEDRRRTAEAGFDHHLVKPAAPDDLTQLFDQIKPAR